MIAKIHASKSKNVLLHAAVLSIKYFPKKQIQNQWHKQLTPFLFQSINLYSLSIFITLLVLALTPKSTRAQVGGLDPSFDVDGRVSTLIGQSSNAYAVALQPDGKIVIAGTCQQNNIAVIYVARYHANGILDSTFDGDGIAITPFSIYANVASAIAIQPDGKIVVAGSIINQGIYDFAVIRYNTIGSLDTSFDGDGKVSTKIGIASDEAYALALQPDGKIVVGGMSVVSLGADFALVRYNTNGSLDTTFSNDGKVTTSLNSGNDLINALVIQPNGKIVVVGYSYLNGTDCDVAVARYNSDGSLDLSFDNDGFVITPFGNELDYATDVLLQPDGKIVVGGQSYNGVDLDMFLLRYLSTGSLDNTFDVDGKVILDINNDNNATNSIALQSDGKILIGGYSANTSIDFCLVRYLPNGTLDNSFDGDGIVTTAITSSLDKANGMVIQPDKKIVLAGYSSINGVDSTVLCRYFMDNALTVSGTNAKASFQIFPNPFSETTTLVFNQELNQASVTLYSLIGQTITILNNVSGNNIAINRNGLPAGLYLIQVSEKDKMVSNLQKIQIRD